MDLTQTKRRTDNDVCESFNGSEGNEYLNNHEFTSLDHAKEVIEAWRKDDNEQRPHGSLGYLTPTEFAKTKPITPRENPIFQF